MWIDGVWSRFQLGNLRGWATPRFGLRRYWNEWELAGAVGIYPDAQEPTCQLRQTREAGHGPWINKYPPTPFAAGGARERRNYQQQVPVQNQRCAAQAVAQRLGPVPGGSFRPCCLTMAKALSFRALALREGPLTGAVQDESQLQEDASKLEAGSAGRQANWRFEGSF